MTTMGKMAISICALAIGIYVSWFVKFGEYTFREHFNRIAETPEVHDLGSGIVTAVASAKNNVRSKVAARLQAARQPSEDTEESGEP